VEQKDQRGDNAEQAQGFRGETAIDPGHGDPLLNEKRTETMLRFASVTVNRPQA
jgi:hypothetical protein